MDNEGKKAAQTDQQALLGRLRDTKELYVIVSACTKRRMLYVPRRHLMTRCWCF